MKRLLSGLAVILISASALATVRTPVATIPGSGAPANMVVAAQNGILAIGNYYTNDIYLYTIGTWQPIGLLTVAGISRGVGAIAIQNDYIAVSAQHYVYIFAKPSGGWGAGETQTATLTPSDGNPYFGGTVAVWGNTLVTTAPNENNEGKAYVFVEPAGGWVNGNETAQLSSEVQCILDAAISGPVGSGGNLIALAEGGTVCVYEEPLGGWVSTGQPTAELTSAGYGAVAIGSDGVIASGDIAYSYDHHSGAVMIFNEPEGGWQSTGAPNYTLTENPSFSLGTSVSLTQNGSVLVGCCGTTGAPGKGPANLAYLWHANQNWGTTIKLSAVSLTTTLQSATNTRDWAFAADYSGNVFIFDGK
jgi:hypothetical protein